MGATPAPQRRDQHKAPTARGPEGRPRAAGCGRPATWTRVGVVLGLFITAGLTGAGLDDQAAPAAKPFKQEIPSAAYAIEMVPVPGDASKGIKPFWISTTEVTWEAFDVFVYSLDEGGEQGERQDSTAPAGAPPGLLPAGGGDADAVTRPSKPYLPPDRGFGHEGYAAICLSHHAAEGFCKWLTARSGKKFRLASEDEWELACGPALPAESLGEHAWYRKNAESKPHRVASKKPNALGVYDMLGNVCEWVNGRDGKPVTKGGSYRDGPEALTPTARQKQDRSWNASDPQVPKSRWWLADGSFVGFRIVCEGPVEDAKKEAGK